MSHLLSVQTLSGSPKEWHKWSCKLSVIFFQMLPELQANSPNNPSHPQLTLPLRISQGNRRFSTTIVPCRRLTKVHNSTKMPHRNHHSCQALVSTQPLTETGVKHCQRTFQSGAFSQWRIQDFSDVGHHLGKGSHLANFPMKTHKNEKWAPS